MAYANGIFPWPSRHTPLLPWFCPSPRTVLIPGHISVSRSARKIMRRNPFTMTYDRAFAEVIRACATVPRDDGGTWITEAMIDGYVRLHELGFAHSVEAWNGDRLVGALGLNATKLVMKARVLLGKQATVDEAREKILTAAQRANR